MKPALLIVCILFSQAILAQRYQKIHRQAIVVDTHNDVLSQVTEKGMILDQDLKGKTHSDLNRWKQGGLDVQVFSVWCSGEKQEPFQYANRQIDSLLAVAARNPTKMKFIRNSQQLTSAVQDKKIAAMIGVEGGHMIENSLEKLDSLYARGTRYMTLTWNNSTDWASSAADESVNKPGAEGLSPFGEEVVQRMNALGMIVDISHVGEKTFADVLRISKKPVIASHSSAYAICPHPRNLKDEQLRALAKNGGVIHVNFYSGFLDSNFYKNLRVFLANHGEERDALMAKGKSANEAQDELFARYPQEVEKLRAPFSLLMQHIEHIIRVAGIDHIGLGSDFDGIDSTPLQLDDVTTYPLITQALVKKGYSKKGIHKLLGGNFMRVLQANEAE